MQSKKDLNIPEWKFVDDYLKKETTEASLLAVIEADKIFIKTAEKIKYKEKGLEKKISETIKSLKNPEKFIKAREKVMLVRSKVGSSLESPYDANDIADIYKEALSDVFYSYVDAKRLASLKIRFWNFYYYILINRKAIYRSALYVGVIILIMLAIADTYWGRFLFDYFIDKIHILLRWFLFLVLFAFALLFFIGASLVFIDSKIKKTRMAAKERAVDNQA